MEARSPQVVEELKMLQSRLADLPVAMPYGLPAGYFESLLPDLRTRMSLEEEGADTSDPVPAFGFLKTPFTVPEGYFSGISAALAPLRATDHFEARLPRTNVFEVPVGYFERLPQAIQAAIDVEAEKLPAGLSRTMPFDVPHHYFEGFSGNLMARVQADDLSEAEKPRTIPLSTRIPLPVQLMRWAAAAILILGVTLGIEQAGTPQNTTATTRRALSDLPENTLQDYVYQHAEEFDIDMIEARLPQSTFQKTSPAQNLDTYEIQDFLSDEALL